MAGAVVSDPPEVIGPVDGVAKPAGKSDSGSSTDSSCVPVSWPLAAASEVIDPVGTAWEAAVPGVAVPGVAGAAEVTAEADGAGVADDAELPEVEHPATVTTRPAVAARTVKARRAPRTATDDTALPTPDLEPDT